MRIVVGVCGGIAAYKVVGVIRTLVLQGHDVQVIPTPEALKFIGAPTLEAISRTPIATDLFDDVADVKHVALGQSADVILIAPATANTIAKLAGGLSDNLLTNSVLASTAPLVIAPAMHTEMWQNPATQHNIATLADRGAHIVWPESGQLTGSDVGVGRLADPESIVAAVSAATGPRDLAGMSVVVTAGGTREPIDPVRFIGNRSSGRQGVALAESARDRGAEVVLIGANLEVAPPVGIETVAVSTVAELRDAVSARADDADIVVMAAAVSDYRPRTVAETKMKKDAVGDDVTIELTQNPDILAELGAREHPRPVLVGFAAETESDAEELIALGAGKAARKNAELVAVNRVDEGRGFGTSDNEVIVVDAAGAVRARASGTKHEVADAILDAALAVRS
ncbi:bifunctional phosphopantothenoylcysteine decarboxylase/phosphopantothenate--cysteine ligase CoaBC [Microbacterium sp. MPKO10]|uniref:bifunctional phosphopantothenoylcysteine decarboxylase/phosphopantothenate--cysteine ligase CoaBC n=1 Tax=Microbacterium sp. MPKO10 TaxID=2989818 RepID=UPI0022364570|nr:bifunctional phosphopantothenoylcysteine decarboxylase/phosphopantothenate--cysteine ligase CoaBC [Microbacterium sp. MPKO10]MCW4458899.1 bifunctional phosphopantothenoylcysteine decarboxylase/phosphopantothenate--cysteine ligase CoaBC [Microbacterium sp. MPKO10]